MSQKISAEELRSIVVQHEGQDQCGYCGGWFTPAPDDIEGVCYVHRGGYSDGALWDAGYGEPE